MPFCPMLKKSSRLIFAAALMLCGGFWSAAACAEPSAQPGQAAAADSPAPAYIPPADVPIPQPKINPAAEAAQSLFAVPQAAENAASAGQKNLPPREQNNAAPAKNPPVPAPAPDSLLNSQKPAALGAADNAAGGNSAEQKNIGLGEAQKLAQDLADRFSKIHTMMGDFVQFDARGGMSTGSFYLERPGKILFDYKDTPVRVICDGRNIAVNNRKLGSWNLYELDKSPLKLLLADKINIANGRLLEFTQEPNAVTMVLGDATGRAAIRLIFDAKTYALKQWTMTDNGQDTTVQITNSRIGVEYAPNMFSINYYRYSKKR